MGRTNPASVSLKWCETHDILKAVLPDGTIYRLGTADIDVEGEHYVGDLKATGEAAQSATKSHDRVTVACQNADRVMGLTINEFSRQLVGATITFSRAFRNVEIAWQAAAGFSLSPDMRGYVTKTGATGWSTSLAVPISAETFSNPATASLSYIVLSLTQAVRFGFLDANNDTWVFELNNGTIRVWVKGTERITLPAKLGDKLIITPDVTGAMHMLVERNSYNGLGVQQVTHQTFAPDINNPVINYPLRVAVDIYDNGATLGGLDIDGHDYQRKEIMSGEIWDAPVDEEAVEITLVGELSSGLAFIADRALQSTCPLVFKGVACGYTGSLTTCNKIYDSPDGCAGRQNQHRFGGVIVRGELSRPIIGGIGEFIDPDGNLRWIPPGGRGRMPFDDRFNRDALMNLMY